jgi:hypothetical protein
MCGHHLGGQHGFDLVLRVDAVQGRQVPFTVVSSMVSRSSVTASDNSRSIIPAKSELTVPNTCWSLIAHIGRSGWSGPMHTPPLGRSSSFTRGAGAQAPRRARWAFMAARSWSVGS